jgi:hypothetical protein
MARTDLIPGTITPAAPTPTSSPASSGQPSGSGSADHRRWIGGAIETLLASYWQERGRPPALADEVLATWMDDLEDFPRDVLKKAITTWRREERKKPCPADLIALGRADLRHRRLLERTTEPKPEPQPDEGTRRISPERAADLMAEMGFAPRRMPDEQGG